MNEKQSKLLRYFERWTGDKRQAAAIRKVFDLADHKTKGKITKFLKTVIVTRMAQEKLAKQAQRERNLQVLAGF